jgi:hypothetical protein
MGVRVNDATIVCKMLEVSMLQRLEQFQLLEITDFSTESVENISAIFFLIILHFGEVLEIFVSPL